MTKTENYSLPQWEADDPVRREDFNGAFAALDRAYSDGSKPYVLGSFSVPSGSETGVALVTFPFKPSAVLFMNGASISLYVQTTSSCKLTINDVSSSSNRYVITVGISGNTLTIQSRSSTSSGYIYYMAFR